MLERSLHPVIVTTGTALGTSGVALLTDLPYPEIIGATAALIVAIATLIREIRKLRMVKREKPNGNEP